MGGRGRWVVAGVALALLVPGAGARASTVGYENPCHQPDGASSQPPCGGTLTFKAAPGEANDISSTLQNGRLHLRDAGASLHAGAGCKQAGEHEAVCPDAFVSIEAGDGDDHVSDVFASVDLGPGSDRLEGNVGSADGGAGDDVISGTGGADFRGGEGDDVLVATAATWHVSMSGGPGDDTLEGGSGDDRLLGGSGADVLRAGAGDDRLNGDDTAAIDYGEGTDSDVLDGGEGTDAADYVNRGTPVAIDLSDPAPDGSAGEADRISGVENVVGGRADDTLVGDAGDNWLIGGPGDDALDGGAGNDDLEGSAGFDSFSGGPGDDRIDSLNGFGFGFFFDPSDPGRLGTPPDPVEEAIDCGAGTDTLRFTYLDLVAANCERVKFAAYTRSASFTLRPSALATGTAAFFVRCPKTLRVRRRCPGRLVLQAGGEARRRNFKVPPQGGPVTVVRPRGSAAEPPSRVRLDLRYDAHPGLPARSRGRYGLATYLELGVSASP